MRRGGCIVAVLCALLAAAANAHAASACGHFGRPAVASDPRPHALRVFAIQFRQEPAAMTSADSFKRAIDCAMRTEVAPHLARGRPNLVVFDEDIGLETLAAGSRGAKARALLRQGVPSCSGQASPCATLATLSAIDHGYGRALTYLGRTFPKPRASSAARSWRPPTSSCARS